MAAGGPIADTPCSTACATAAAGSPYPHAASDPVRKRGRCVFLDLAVPVVDGGAELEEPRRIGVVVAGPDPDLAAVRVDRGVRNLLRRGDQHPHRLVRVVADLVR